MPPKASSKKDAPKPAKKTAEEEAKEKADAVNDIDDESYKKTLRAEARALRLALVEEEKMAGLYQAERHRMNYFWIFAKKELEDKQAELRNKERELQDLKEKHQIEIKVYKQRYCNWLIQRVKHLLFQNLDELTELKKEAELTLKNVEDDHRINQREPKADKRGLNVQLKEQEVRHQEYLRAIKREFDKKSSETHQEYERQANEIKMKYTHKMALLRKEMDEKRKFQISQIENKKNVAIKELTAHHAKKFTDIKSYYQEITNTNLDLIKQMQDDVNELKRKEADDLKMLYEAELENKQYSEPLKKAAEDVQRLKKEKEMYNKDMAELHKTKELIMEQERIYKENEWEYEVLLQQYQYLEREKKELFDNFNNTIYEIHQKTGLKNLILEKKLETIEEAIEVKDAQLNQLLSAAKIDPASLGVIRSTLEEVENLKNEAIKEIQMELKKIREAHSNMVKTYEGKLSEFGIPVEELGFDPLVPANI